MVSTTCALRSASASRAREPRASMRARMRKGLTATDDQEGQQRERHRPPEEEQERPARVRARAPPPGPAPRCGRRRTPPAPRRGSPSRPDPPSGGAADRRAPACPASRTARYASATACGRPCRARSTTPSSGRSPRCGAMIGEYDEIPIEGLPVLHRRHHQRAHGADADQREDPGHAEEEHDRELGLPGQDVAEELPERLEPAHALRAQDGVGRLEVSVLGIVHRPRLDGAASSPGRGANPARARRPRPRRPAPPSACGRRRPPP